MTKRWQRAQRVTSDPASQDFMEYLDGLARDIDGKAALVHTHEIADVNGLAAALAASGGGATGGAAVLDFGAAPGSGVASVAITGQAALGASARIRAWVQGSTADHNEYEHTRIFPARIGLAAGDVVAATGFTIHAETELRLTGEIAVNWEWS